MLQKMNEDGRLLKSLRTVCETDNGRKRFCTVLCKLLEQPEQTIGVIRKAIRHVMPYQDYLQTEHWKTLSRKQSTRLAVDASCVTQQARFTPIIEHTTVADLSETVT
jgi:hypothetical protein